MAEIRHEVTRFFTHDFLEPLFDHPQLDRVFFSYLSLKDNRGVFSSLLHEEIGLAAS